VVPGAAPREMGAKAGSSERDQDRDGRPLNHVDPKIGSWEERIITRKGKNDLLALGK
jgi:hypothetical protein